MTELLAAAWMSKLPMDIINRVGLRYGVDPFLIAAICMEESSGRPNVTKFEPNYKWLYKPEEMAAKLDCSVGDEKKGQMTSYGFMQIMGAVMREYGFAWSFALAFIAETNIDYGTRHLASFLKRYETSEKAIASYNAGSPRYKAGSRVLENQDYVDNVMKYWKEAAGVKSIA